MATIECAAARRPTAGILETYKGSCHCGDVEFAVLGEPRWSAICHCSICRSCHSAPYAELCAYNNDRVKITKGLGSLVMYNVCGKSKEDRYFCKSCGSRIYSVLHHLGCTAVYLQNFTTPNHGPDGKIDSRFAPSCHIFYGSGTVSSYDKLPKFETLPTAFGGDGKELPNGFHDKRIVSSRSNELWLERVAKGACHCGDVEFEAVGLPDFTANCHSSTCRACHSAPYADLCVYETDKVKITKGKRCLTKYNARGKIQEDRYFCRNCGSLAYTVLNHLSCKAVSLQNLTVPNHSADGTIDARFAADCHILYGSGTVSFHDRLPKYDTLPTMLGGDGKELPNNFHDMKVAAKL